MVYQCDLYIYSTYVLYTYIYIMKKVPLLVLKELGYIYQLYQLCQFHWHHSLG